MCKECSGESIAVKKRKQHPCYAYIPEVIFYHLYIVKVKSLSHVFGSPWTIAYQAPPSIHGIFQARVLEWVAISFSGGLPDPGIEPRSPTL